MRLHSIILLVLVALSASGAAAQLETKLVPESLEAGDFFGRSVAFSADGRNAIVGASEEVDVDTTDGGVESGRVYVYEQGAEGWIEQQVLSPSDPDSLSNFGRALAISNDGEHIFVGAPYSDILGATYVFANDGTGWTEEAKLEVIDDCGTPLQCRFGWALATSAEGDVLIVGAPDDAVSGVRSGSLNVFTRTLQGWEAVTKLVASTGSFVGIAAAISDDGQRAFAGTHHCCGSGQIGHVLVFEKTSEEWVQTADLSGSDAEPDSRFGNEIATTPDGNWLLVGADGADDIGSSSGAAYLFQFEANEWIERQRLTASDAVDQDFFGSGVALTQDAGILIVGALGQDAEALDTGAAYVFVRNGSIWDEHTMLVSSDRDERDFLGEAIAVTPDGSHVLFGVPVDDDRGDASGSAYIFDLPSVLPLEESPTSPPTAQLALYPNPSRGQATISISLSKPVVVRVALFDLLGREVQHLWNGQLNSGDHNISVDASSLPSGTYVVRATTAIASRASLFTVQK